MERCEPLLLVLDVDVGAVLDEQLHDVDVVVAGRVVQRGDPVLVERVDQSLSLLLAEPLRQEDLHRLPVPLSRHLQNFTP